MFELNGIWYKSVRALETANPSMCIDASVGCDITLSPAWGRELLPNDAAALMCASKTRKAYNTLAREENNSEFGKHLCASPGAA